jgi:toluene monooxygenase system ferredoxin subunit
MAWTKACKTGDVAENAIRQVEVNGVSLLVANLGGEYFAYPPLCPHMAEPLEISGVCDGKLLTCTKHLWQWDMRTGAPLGMAERELLLYPVSKDGDDVLVDLERELVYDYDD